MTLQQLNELGKQWKNGYIFRGLDPESRITIVL